MRRILAMLAVLAVGLLPACAEASAQELIAKAPEVTTDQGTAKMAMTMDMTGGAQDITINAEGAVDFESQAASMTMDLGALGAQSGMGKIEMLTEGTTVYMKFPNAQQLGIPTAWVKMDLEAMTGLQGMESLSQINNNDPSKQMEMLRGVSDDIEEVGTEDVRGTETTHYTATIDVDKALEELPEDAQASFKKQYETMGLDTLPVEIWLDGDGLLRRQKVSVDLSNVEGAAAVGGQAPTAMVMDMEFYDFGAEVNVEPPPANEVTDFAELQGGG